MKEPNKKQTNMDVASLLAEIETLKAEIARLRAPKKSVKPIRVPCPGMTGKGVQCKKYCVEGGDSCKVHSRPPKSPKAPKAPKAQKAPKVVCTGLNMRGNPCKRKCIDGETFCDRHDPSAPQKEKKGKAKVKKVTPLHNHKIDEEPLIPCELCETHGDMFDKDVTNVEMIGEWGEIDENKLVELIENFNISDM